MKPKVWAMVLTTGARPQWRNTVLKSILDQSYECGWLILDTASQSWSGHQISYPKPNFMEGYIPDLSGKPIGALRNAACALIAEAAHPGAVVMHFDDDDWSHPSRAEEQVKLLQDSGAPMVCYSEMLFWDQMRMRHEAWIYKSRNPSVGLGASFCYWLDTWKKHPFTELNTPEDTYWQLHGVVGCPVSSIVEGQPRMICRLHPGSTPEGTNPLPPHGKRIPDVREWTRAEQWDRYCKERM